MTSVRGQNVGYAVDNQEGSAPTITDQHREPIGNARSALGRAEQYDVAVGGEAAAIKGCNDFLPAEKAGKLNSSIISSDMARVVRRVLVDRMASTPNR